MELTVTYRAEWEVFDDGVQRIRIEDYTGTVERQESAPGGPYAYETLHGYKYVECGECDTSEEARRIVEAAIIGHAARLDALNR
jgi:hypothetical protein